MVISYTIEELNAIGEMVTLKDVLSRIESSAAAAGLTTTTATATTTTNNNNNNTNHNNNNNDNDSQNFQPDFLQFHQQMGSQANGDKSQEPLTYSVAEFFRKAQQNFYAQTSIDPTKVRSLSEVEAELIGRRESS